MAFWAVKIGFSWFPIDGPALDLLQRGVLQLPQTPAAFNTSIFSRITIKKLIQTLCCFDILWSNMVSCFGSFLLFFFSVL